MTNPEDDGPWMVWGGYNQGWIAEDVSYAKMKEIVDADTTSTYYGENNESEEIYEPGHDETDSQQELGPFEAHSAEPGDDEESERAYHRDDPFREAPIDGGDVF
jgi:hypothetical protein